MFWIGIIVGIIIGVVGLGLIAMKITNMSFNEMSECGWCMIDAGRNRESTMIVYYDNEPQNVVILEEKE